LRKRFLSKQGCLPDKLSQTEDHQGALEFWPKVHLELLKF
jgi:hypothetical protein